MGYSAKTSVQKEAQKHLPDLEAAIIEAGVHWVSVPLLLAIVDRETLWGQSPAYKDYNRPHTSDEADDRGDGGHGHGFFQIDDRSHAIFIRTGKWKIVKEAAIYAIKSVLLPNYKYIKSRFSNRTEEQLYWDAVAGYNCGAGNVRRALLQTGHRDSRTTGRDYSKDVHRRLMEFWIGWYWDGVRAALALQNQKQTEGELKDEMDESY